MNFKKMILPTFLIWIVGTVFVWLTCGWLFTWVYEIEPLIWVAPEVMMSTENMIYMNLLTILLSFFFVMVYSILYKGIPGTGVKKGMTYGLLITLVAGAGMLTMPLYMTIAWTVVIYWVLQQLVANLIKGFIVGKLYK